MISSLSEGEKDFENGNKLCFRWWWWWWYLWVERNRAWNQWKKAVVIIFNKARVLTFDRFYLYSTFSWFELSRGLSCRSMGRICSFDGDLWYSRIQLFMSRPPFIIGELSHDHFSFLFYNGRRKFSSKRFWSGQRYFLIFFIYFIFCRGVDQQFS